jgi:hypothetical protein
MSIARDRVGDAAHQPPNYRVQAPAAHHYQPHVERLGRAQDLLFRVSAPQMGLRDLRAVRLEPLRLLFEERLGIPLGPPMGDSLISSE